MIAFCPNCNSYDYLECEYGYGPVVPCKIYHGSREIGMVTYDKMDRMKYRIDSDVFNIHKVLENTYLNALYEAKDMVTDLLQEIHGKWYFVLLSGIQQAGFLNPDAHFL